MIDMDRAETGKQKTWVSFDRGTYVSPTAVIDHARPSRDTIDQPEMKK